MIYIQYKYFLTAEHIRIHSVHIVHFHHILHTATLLRKSDHRCSSLIFQLLYFYFKFILAKILTEHLSKCLDCCFIRFSVFAKLFCQICINSLELDRLILLFKMGNKL